MMPAQKRFAIASSTRADWGLLSPVAREVRDYGFGVDVLATNMHLLPEAGMTVDEIIADGFEPIRIPATGTPSQISAQVLEGFARQLSQRRYEAIVILGDRFEMLAVAQAAVLAGVPIVHIAGGTVSEGAFDEYFRHAITKMAYLHLTETDLCAARVRQMGEAPEMVHTVGSLGVARFLSEPQLPIVEVERFAATKIDRNTLLITLHHASRSDTPFEKQYSQLFEAFATLPPHYKFLFTRPNNDTGPANVINILDTYARLHPGRVTIVPSLGYRRYITAVRHVGAVVGNSSSGLVEVPSTGTPTLDIGCRQNGREHGPSVIRCGASASEIAEGLRHVLSPQHLELSRRCINPYARPDTIRRIVSIISNTCFPHAPQKIFHEI